MNEWNKVDIQMLSLEVAQAYTLKKLNEFIEHGDEPEGVLGKLVNAIKEIPEENRQSYINRAIFAPGMKGAEKMFDALEKFERETLTIEERLYRKINGIVDAIEEAKKDGKDIDKLMPQESPLKEYVTLMLTDKETRRVLCENINKMNPHGMVEMIQNYEKEQGVLMTRAEKPFVGNDLMKVAAMIAGGKPGHRELLNKAQDAASLKVLRTIIDMTKDDIGGKNWRTVINGLCEEGIENPETAKGIRGLINTYKETVQEQNQGR